jgi:hypothetical protein
MVKRPEESFDNKLIDSLTPEDRRRNSSPGDSSSDPATHRHPTRSG